MPVDRGVCDKRYRLERILGRGASGVVYQATDLITGTPCALKRLHAHFHDQRALGLLQGDAQRAADLHHPAVLPVRATGVDEDGSFYLVSDLHGGDSLRSRLSQGPLTLLETSALLQPVCAALHAAALAGLHHGDLHPGNILCPSKDGGRTVLTDFGLYHLGHPGNPEYLPPEVFRGEVEGATARGDVFALGALLFECLAGQRLFDAPTSAAVMFKVCLAPLPSLDALLPARAARLAPVIEMACNKDPDARFETAGALWGAMAAVAPVEVRHQGAPIPLVSAAPQPVPLAAPIARRSTLENWMVEERDEPVLQAPSRRPAFGGLVLSAGLGALVMGGLFVCGALYTGRLPHLFPSPAPSVLVAALEPTAPIAAPVPAPVVDDAAVLGEAQRQLGERDYPAALSQASDYLRRHPGDPAAETISQQAIQALRLLSVYDGFTRAAERGDVDTAVALHRELLPGSPYYAQAEHAFAAVRELFEQSHLQVISAALKSGVCDEVQRQVEQLRVLGDESEGSAYEKGHRLLLRCHGRDTAKRTLPPPRASDLRDPFRPKR